MKKIYVFLVLGLLSIPHTGLMAASIPALTPNQTAAVMGIITNFILDDTGVLDKIKAYATTNGTSPAPTVQDYANIGVTGITATNLTDMNQLIQNSTASQVNSKTKLQLLANMLNDTTTPVFTSTPSASVEENQLSAITLMATDNSQITYSISGMDANSFDVDSASGVVTFIGVPDFETKNIYIFMASATDTSNNHTNQNITIHILDVDESATFRPFKLKVKTDNYGQTSDVKFKIPIVRSLDNNYSVDCNDDGIFEAVNLTEENYNYTCDYTDLGGAGIYTISITGVFSRIYFFNINTTKRDNSKVLEIVQWGDIQWSNMDGAFAFCENMAITATDKPDLSHVDTMSAMLAYTNFADDISDWNVSNVTNMRGTFEYSSFNQDISNWNVSNVTNMSAMFEGTTSFNQDISNWNVSNVTDMSVMFGGATSFTNHDLSGWNVQNVTNHGSFFNNAGSGNIEPDWP